MILNRLKSRDGFTLIELLLFSVIFALVTVAFVGIFIVITRIQSRETSSISVGQEAQFLTQTIQSLVHRSSLIEMTADATTTIITLRMASSVLDPTTVYVVGGKAFLRETVTGTPQPLTSDRVTLSNVSFAKRSNPRAYDSLRVSFLISANTSSSQQAASQAVNISVARRSPATFDSDIQPISGQSIRLGTTSNQIQSINGTLFFQDGSVGISSNGETPVDRLQVSDGGLMFTNLPDRPACNTSTRGTLWFLATSTGDSLSMCFLSSAGVYYWNQSGVSASSTSFIDSTGNTGIYNSMTAAKNDRDYVYVSYYDEANNRLRFSSSSQGGVWTSNGGMIVDQVAGGNVGQHNSITAPTTSTIFISYYDVSSNTLKFASSTNGGRTWSNKTLTSGGNNGQYSSISAPTTSTIHISYYDASNNRLLVLSSSNGGLSWTGAVADSSANVGQGSMIVSPQADTVYICYYDSTNNKPKFAWSTNYGLAGSWNTTTTDASITGGGTCAISAPTTSTILIAYYDKASGGTDGSLKFIRSTTGPTGFEAPQYIDSAQSQGRWLGMDTIDGKVVYIGYHSLVGTNHLMRQAFSQLSGALGMWTTSTALLDPGNFPARYIKNAVAIDQWTYAVGYTVSGLALKAYKVFFNSPLFN